MRSRFFDGKNKHKMAIFRLETIPKISYYKRNN